MDRSPIAGLILLIAVRMITAQSGGVVGPPSGPPSPPAGQYPAGGGSGYTGNKPGIYSGQTGGSYGSGQQPRPPTGPGYPQAPSGSYTPGGPSYRAPAPGPSYGSGAVPSYSAPPSGPSYSGPPAGPSYSGSGAGPSYSGPPAGPSYSGSGAGPSYSGPPAGPSYSGSGAGPSYSGPPAGPSYSGSGAGPSYSGPPAGPSYSGSGAGPSYSGSGLGPSYSGSGAGPSYIGSGTGPSYSGSGSGGYSGAGQPSYSGVGAGSGAYSQTGGVYGSGGDGGYSGSGNSDGQSYSSGGSYGGGSDGGAGYGAGGGSYAGGGGSYGGDVGPTGGCCGGLGKYGAVGSYGTGGCGGCGDNSDPCFRKFSNCIIVNAQPYERRSQITLDQCKAYCRNSTSGQYQCRSFVYDNVNQICDLFAHTGNQPPAKLVRYSGRDYYEATGITNCTTTAIPGTPAPTGPCTSGQKAAYIQVPGYQYTGGGAGTQSPGTSIQTCIDACNAGQTSDGKSITCKSFDYNNGQCIFYATAVPAGGKAAGLQASSGSIHVDQVCVDSGQACTGPAERDPQMILVGFAEMIVDAKDFNDCMQKCINAQASAGINCKSGMFYFQETTNNCILNTETKTTHPDLFNKENQDTVDYFEPNCDGATVSTATNGGNSTRRLLLLRGLLNKKNAPSLADDSNTVRNDQDTSTGATPLDEWTHWSPCDRRKDGRRIRYRVCTKPSLKECPFETEWCNSDKASKKSPSASPLFGLTAFTLRNITQTSQSSMDPNCAADACCAVFGGCRIGIRRSSANGQLIWCTNPCQDGVKKWR